MKNTTADQNALLEKGWLSTLPKPIQREIMERLHWREYKRDAAIYQVEDADSFMFGVSYGVIAGYLEIGGRSPHFYGLAFPGYWGGDPTVTSNDKRRAHVIARTDCRLGVLTQRDVSQIAETHPQLWRYIAHNTHALFDDLAKMTATLLLPEARSRILMALVRLLRGSLEPTSFELSIEELGQLTGDTRNSVAPALQRLVKEGLVERSYRRIDIPDPKALLAELTQATRA